MNALKAVLPVLVLAAGAGGAWALWTMREKPARRDEARVVPLVRVEAAAREDVRLSVRVHGTVAPRTESRLVPEVPGRILRVSPSFATGGFFEPGETLVEIDPTDYALAVAQAEAQVAQAKHRLARERAEAEVARREWKEFGEGEPDPLVLREPQLAEARATLASAEAAVARARLNLDRTAVKAPFAGRVRTKHVDVGQYVAPGTPLADVYAVDFAEVRLPIPLEELAYVDLPLDYRGERGDAADADGPAVTFRARIGGATHAWTGRIVRTAAEIDPRTRMLTAVARVDDPYGRGGPAGRPPFMVGLFVEAEIEGLLAEGAFVLPRAALRPGDQVWVVDAEDRIRFRDVRVLRADGGRAIVGAGLEEGDRVCVTMLDVAVDGMKVDVHAAEEAGE